MSTTDAARRSKRVSLLPAAPKAPTTLDATAVISERAILTGIHPITIGPNAVLHPSCKIVSVDGPVTIGAGAIIWEKAVVGVGEAVGGDGAVGKAAPGRDQSVTIGSGVVIESAAVVEAQHVGDGTVIEAFAKVGSGSIIGKFCKVGNYVEIAPNSKVADYTIVFGQSQQRLDTTLMANPLIAEIKEAAHSKQLTTLRSLIPSNLAKWQ